jgi:hypothetical protein
MKNAAFWDVTPRDCFKNRRFRGTHCLHHHFVATCFGLLVTVNVVPSSTILVTLIMEVIRSSETLVVTRTTWHITVQKTAFSITAIDSST